MTIHCKGELVDLSVPKVMGILNVTPDSFYDGGRYKDEKAILLQAEKMICEGAAFLDVGGYSSRPGADHISEDEELKRTLPVIQHILNRFPEVLLSVDTFRSTVAAHCIEAGAAVINDISAGSIDAEMMTVVAKYQVPYIMMHMRGTPQNMQKYAQYNDVVKEIVHYFSEKTVLARKYGITDLIVDPGFGFSKTVHHNYEILNKFELFNVLEVPLLVGLSRKSMVCKILDITAAEALNGTTALHAAALLKGAHILRVHDVKEAVECVKLIRQLKHQQ